MRVALAADHGGYHVKAALIEFLESEGHEVLNYGTDTAEACDYPDTGFQAAQAVASGMAEFGVVICKSGIGMSIVANKVKGVRAALCSDAEDASSARRHNHANVLALSGNRTSPAAAIEMLRVFISTAPEPGRHERRVRKITDF
jgi:ribose 5-phosphate isomerase B